MTFDDVAGVWRERQALTSRDGLVTAQFMTLRPIADGLCAVELTHGEAPANDHHHHHGRSGSRGKGGYHHHLHRWPGAGAGGGGTYASAAADRAERAAHPYGGSEGASAGTGVGVGGFIGPHEDMTLQELSDSVLVLTSVSRTTGRPVMIETICVTSDLSRTRTVQRFDPHGEGAPAAVYVIRETRVIDAVTGAMMEPLPRAATAQYHHHAGAGGGGGLPRHPGAVASGAGTSTTTTGSRSRRGSAESDMAQQQGGAGAHMPATPTTKMPSGGAEGAAAGMLA